MARTTMLLSSVTLTVAVGLTACASTSSSALEGNDPSASAVATSVPSQPPPVGAPSETWVAVLDTAADPGRLNGPRKDVLHELGDVLEGSVVISPGACLDGLPDALSDGYVLAIQRESEADVRSLASLLSEEPSFLGDVTIMCSD
jgi:ABC-type amino acid transport substrate-binding protein